MIIYILIIILLILFILYSIQNRIFENFISDFNNQCVKLHEKCIVYNLGSEDESNNCCTGYCVRKDNNFQYKVCSDKPEYIYGKLGNNNNNLPITTTTSPPTTLDNSLNGKKNRFCNAAFLDWNLFNKVKHEQEEDNHEEEHSNLYNPFENISTNKCGIFNFGPIKDSNDTALNKSGTKCNGFFVDLF